MLILSARVIWASSIDTRWLTGSDWFSQGQDGLAPAADVRAAAGLARATGSSTANSPAMTANLGK